MATSRFGSSAALAACLILAGCAQIRGVPEPSEFPREGQAKMQAARHWDIVAGHVASSIFDAMLAEAARPIHVVAATGNSPFHHAFREMLRAHLMNKGFTLTPDANAPVRVDVNVTVLEHHDRDVRRIAPGSFLVLAGAAVGGATAVANWSNPELLAVPGALGLELGNALSQWSVPNHEVIITTAATDASRYLFSKTDVYYINDPDSAHYLDTTPPPANVPSTPSRRIKVVAQ